MPWVYKSDGTRQCGLGEEIPLEVMRDELKAIISEGNIIDQEKRIIPISYPAVCGHENGHVNAYKITQDGAKLLFDGFIGKNGFELWAWREETKENTRLRVGAFGGSQDLMSSGPPDVLPWSVVAIRRISAGKLETRGAEELSINSSDDVLLIQDLRGYKLRILRSGQHITREYLPNRINITVDEDGIIEAIGLF